MQGCAPLDGQPKTVEEAVDRMQFFSAFETVSTAET